MSSVYRYRLFTCKCGRVVLRIVIMILIVVLSACPRERKRDISPPTQIEEQQIEEQQIEAPAVGDIISITEVGRYSVDEVNEEIVPFFGSYTHPPMRYGVTHYFIRYASSDFDGAMVEIVAQLFVPHVDRNAAFPLYVFGSGTTGLPDKCAPSLEKPHTRRWGWYKQNMLAYGASGYIVVFPDYVGFNDDDRPQRYFSKQAEGHVMLDAVRAAYNIFTQSLLEEERAILSSRTFLAGYSQGGHAAFAAADIRAEYAPDISISGLIGYGQTNDIAALFREGVCYAPSIIFTFMRMYGEQTLNPADYLAARFIPTFEDDTTSMCVDEFQLYYGFDAEYLFTESFYEALFSQTLHDNYPVLAEYIAINNSGLSGHGLPALVIQGDEDFIVTTDSQTRFVEALREAGSEVDFMVYPGVTHKFTRMAGFSDSVRWMQSF